MKKDITRIRSGNNEILVIGHHRGIVQSVLDFDFLAGKEKPSVSALILGNRKTEKYFFGTKEIVIPCFPSVIAVPESIRKNISWMLNVQSGRRVLESTSLFFEAVPHALGGHMFAENVPELHAQELIRRFSSAYTIVGPSGVGFLIPGVLKLGAIGGVEVAQLEAGKLLTQGNVAVVSTSGGMTNELIRAVVGADRRVSFAVALGGDRFPALSLKETFMLAEKDVHTDAVVYFGELGGSDEYEIIDLIEQKKYTKPLVAYIAGVIDESFPQHVQFGHAKALVQNKDESARAKRIALRNAGVTTSDTFDAFLHALKTLPQKKYIDPEIDLSALALRRASILSTRVLGQEKSVQKYVKNKKIIDTENVFVTAALGALLGRTVRSDVTKKFVEIVFATLFDNGGHVSGAVNTMITARAGKDMVSSLAAGLLTIGPRFGGAVNQAARLWCNGVQEGVDPRVFVDQVTAQGQLILGIGHKKYHAHMPDPRVEALASFVVMVKKHPHYDFARAVEQVTTTKSGSLILNVDGLIAAIMLDVLSECEELDHRELIELIDVEFFNALFIIPRTVGFIGHFMEQKRNDEGLFRLPDDLLFEQE